MTNKQSNEEKQHTDKELTEETNLPSTEDNSEKNEATISSDEEMSFKEKDVLEEEELEFDEEAQSDEEAMAAAKELDQLDQDADDVHVEAEAELGESTSGAKQPEQIMEEDGVSVSEESEEETREQRREKRREKKPRLRLIPIWLRILISLLLIGGSLILGMMFGYGVIGGGEPGEAIRPETWYHIVDIIRGN
ncbi:DNA-directed RNA polymerase subunit beta [Halalkalibacter alkalisediminis]|uniref:DNA-directed RNA polymerase subunit beta n=1 Tax=Halalkalibacter alkalisediminis TaxID=935616 RepID=A0ABV6NJU7_9BACI|nr:DNA-directed RNA polymerase subunit beta [Halalkalibacter alkalisediminis]